MHVFGRVTLQPNVSHAYSRALFLGGGLGGGLPPKDPPPPSGAQGQNTLCSGGEKTHAIYAPPALPDLPTRTFDANGDGGGRGGVLWVSYTHATHVCILTNPHIYSTSVCR